MATTKPRITITLSDRQHQLLKAISESSGQSMSAFIGELLESAEPVFERLAATFQAMKSAKTKERARLVQTLDDAQTALEPLAMAAVDQLDMFLGNVEKAAGVPEGMRSSRDGTPADAAPIPRTNRGVTPSRANIPKPAPVNDSRAVSEKQKFSKRGKKAGMQPS